MTAPAGDRFVQHVVALPRVAVALVVDRTVDPAGRVLVLRTYRHPVGRWGHELPGGGVDPGEDPAAAAAREAAEETGLRPLGPGRHLVTFEPLPGGVRAETHVQVWDAAGAVPTTAPTGLPRDPLEPGRTAWVPLADVPALAAAGELLGAGTLVGLLLFLAERGLPSNSRTS